MPQMADGEVMAASALQRSRRTIEAVSYGVGVLVSQLEGEDAGDAGEPAASGSGSGRDALFGHIRQLLEHSFGGCQAGART